MTDGISGALRELGRQNPHISVALNKAADEIEKLRDHLEEHESMLAKSRRETNDAWREVNRLRSGLIEILEKENA